MFLAGPFLAIFAILAYYQFLRVVWKRKKRKRMKNLGFCPSSLTLGLAFQFMSVFYRPTVAHAIQAMLQEGVEEDDQGDPETPEKHLQRQLRRIRRGERIETLVLKL
jgi:hypothetical protein